MLLDNGGHFITREEFERVESEKGDNTGYSFEEHLGYEFDIVPRNDAKLIDALISMIDDLQSENK